ncbi:hypothetical protein [Paenibacillus harenae]|uniref:hypothetical protein n=1 Tax=Paenibacillus harenae TaxID=306543 RepID=UPI0004203B19|nr:hypothetical protein [Paenibacillus harenae]
MSKVYKLETSENISDYVQRVKMEKAEYMLKHSDDKIYEIANNSVINGRIPSFMPSKRRAAGI